MLRRVLMRRAYNAGHYETAREHARRLLSNPKERALARSVMVRSYWNEQAFQALIDVADGWEDELVTSYCALARDRLNTTTSGKALTPMKQERLERLRSEQPEPKHAMEWNTIDMPANFSQEGERLWFRYPQGYVYWDMPKGYDLSSTHEALLRLAAETLLSPWEPSTRAPFPSARTARERASLSFSAGTDSTAAALVMPDDTLLGYHRRSFKSMLDHRNAERLIDHLNGSGEREVLQIESNHELIRTHHDKPVGFSCDFACAVHLILLADHYNLGAIGFGMPIDNTFLWKGRKFRAFEETHYFRYWTKRFHEAGLDLLFPISSISEAGALMIVKQSSWVDHLNSCMRGDGTKGCGRCWKCFHKNGPLGRPVDLEAREIRVYLAKRPFPTSTHALWALQQYGREDMLPDLPHLFEMNYAWWEGYYPPGFLLLPQPLKEHIQPQIEQLLEPMPIPYALETLDHFDEGF